MSNRIMTDGEKTRRVMSDVQKRIRRLGDRMDSLYERRKELLSRADQIRRDCQSTNVSRVPDEKIPGMETVTCLDCGDSIRMVSEEGMKMLEEMKKEKL